MSLCNSLCEDSWILRVEQKINSGQFDILLFLFDLSVPIACVDLAFFIIGVDEYWAPMANTVDHMETFSRNRLERAVFLLTVLDPLGGLSAVVLGVVEWLEGKPVGWGRFWIGVINSL